MTRPTFNQLWRYVGQGRGHGSIHRILRCNWREIGTVQDSVQPDWSWLGEPEEFVKNFVFVSDVGYNNRKGGHFNVFGW